MSQVSVTQFITDEGKIQIDVTNTSGRSQAISREHTASSENTDGVAVLRDQEEPCSLIVSLRSSHPQFFFYRGPQPKTATSTTVASPLRLWNGNGSGTGSTGGGHHQHRNHHRHTGSALWAHQVVDPVVLEVSRQTWKEHNFAPVALDPSIATNNNNNNNSSSSNNKTDGRRGAASGHPSFDGAAAAAAAASEVNAVNSDSRPLLVREEMADCVLLPGERRTFFVEVSNPAVLARLVAPKQPTKAARAATGSNLRLNSGQLLPAVIHHHGSGSEVEEKDPNAPSRDQTDVFYRNDHTPLHLAKPNGDTACGRGNAAIGRDRNGEEDASDTDEYGRSPSRQPLSIVGDSSTTRASVDPARNSLGRQQQQQQQSRPIAAQDSLRSSRDYAVPPSSSSTSDLALSNDVRCTKSRRTSQVSPGESQPLAKGSGSFHGDVVSMRDGGSRYAPPSLSQRPVFYIYYHPLGDENRCVDRARKWIAKEQHTYHEWRDGLVRTIAEHERKREHVWAVMDDRTLLPPQPRLEVKRILPPVLGELVRWRNDDGGSSYDGDAMLPSPVTVSAFHYYYSRLNKSGSGGPHVASASGLKRSTSSMSGRHGVPEVPPSFAATRANRVSKKAKKMFNGNRQGAGTVVMPLRVPHDIPSGSSTNSKALRRDSSTYSEATTPVKGPTSSSMGMPRPPPLQHSQSPSQQQTRGGSQHSMNSETQFSITPPHAQGLQRHPASQQSRAGGGDDDTDLYAASATPSESALRDSAAWRPRTRTGRGLALLEDSVNAPPSPSGYGSSEVVPSSGDYQTSAGDYMSGHLNASAASASARWGRTNTLDPDTAELAARGSMPSRPGFGDVPGEQRESAYYPLTDARPALPSFPSTLEGSRSMGSGLEKTSLGPDMLATPFASTSRQLGNSHSSSNLNGQLSDGGAVADENAAVEEAVGDANNPGSFVANLIQSFCARRDTTAENAGNTAVDEDGASPHIRDISSAPPQRVTYRRPISAASNASFGLSGMSSSSFAAQRQQHLRWLAGHSKAAKGHAQALAQQLTEMIALGAALAVDLLNAHGPTAVEGVVMGLGFLQDNIFTPENVKMMGTVITPMVMLFAMIALLYLLFFGGGGADEALPPLFGGSL